MTEQAPEAPASALSKEEADSVQLERYPDTVTDQTKAEIMAYAGASHEQEVVKRSKEALDRITTNSNEVHQAATMPDSTNLGSHDFERDVKKIVDARREADKVENAVARIYDEVKRVGDEAKSGKLPEMPTKTPR